MDNNILYLDFNEHSTTVVRKLAKVSPETFLLG